MDDESIIVNVNLTSMFLKNNYDTIEKTQDIIFSINESRDAIALGYQKEAIDYSIDKLTESLDKKLVIATMI